MEEELEALGHQQRELTGMLAPLSDADWSRPSACDGWTVGDVVLHLIQTNDMAIASAEDRFDEVLTSPLYAPDDSVSSLDDMVDLAVQRARGSSPSELLAQWSAGCERLRTSLVAAGEHARLPWIVGTLSARTLATTRLAETWIHTGDVAAGLGVEQSPGDPLRLIARLAWRTLPHAFGREGLPAPGPVGFDLEGPSGEAWAFGMDDSPPTVIAGSAVDLCRVASKRSSAADTDLVGTGPDAAEVLQLVRTWA